MTEKLAWEKILGIIHEVGEGGGWISLEIFANCEFAFANKSTFSYHRNPVILIMG